jgi:preprotein translocase subunit SecG
MQTFILVIHLILAIAMVAVILLQRSEGGGLGIGGGSGGGGGGGFMTGRDTANLLTRTTAFLAVGFIATSLTLAILASNSSKKGSILDSPTPAVQEAPKPTGPSAPLAN